MLVSECCGAIVYDDYDLCSECLEHCDVWDDEVCIVESFGNLLSVFDTG